MQYKEEDNTAGTERNLTWAKNYLMSNGMSWLSAHDLAREIAIIECIDFVRPELKRMHAELREAILITLTQKNQPHD